MYSYFLKYWGGWNPNAFRAGFNINNIKIIENNHRRIGYYDIEVKNNKFLYINNIQLSKRWRGKGLGALIMDLIDQEAKKHKLNTLRLKVFKDNLAINLYKKLGYKEIENNISEVILEKLL